MISTISLQYFIFSYLKISLINSAIKSQMKSDNNFLLKKPKENYVEKNKDNFGKNNNNKDDEELSGLKTLCP